MALELFANIALTTVTSGGTTAPSAGTQQTWTVSSATGFPSVSSSIFPQTLCYISDTALRSEIIEVINTSGTTWTVVRGAQGTTPVAHSAAGFQVYLIGTAGTLGNFPQVYNVRSILYGAKGNGSTDDTTAIQNALTACVNAGGGILYVPEGTYKTTTTITQDLNGASVYILGAGRWATTIAYYGSGDCLRIYNSNYFSGGNLDTGYGGGIRGITFDGTNASGSAASSGLHMGDLFQFEIDIAAQNFTFTGSYGVHLDNQYFWTEQLRGDIYASNCATMVGFDANTTNANATGSFYRDELNIWVNQIAFSQNGVTFLNGTYIQDGALAIRGNFIGSASVPTSSGSWVLGLTGVAPVGRGDAGSFSFISTTRLDIQVECDSALANGPYTIYFDTSNVGYVYDCYGVLNFANDTTFFTGTNNGGQIGNYIGPTNGDPGILNVLPEAASNVANGAQTINAISSGPASITDLAVFVNSGVQYNVRVFIPYTSTHAAGTPSILWSAPAVSNAGISYWFHTTASPFKTALSYSSSTTLPTMTGPVLASSGNFALEVEGSIIFGTPGTLQMTAYTSNATDTFVIGSGSFIELINNNSVA